MLACAAGACGESPSDPEAALRASLTEAQAAAEEGEADRLVAMLHPDYADAAGRDRRGMAKLVRGLLLRYRHLELAVTVTRLELFSPVLARVELEVVGLGAGGAAGLSVDRFPLELSLRDDGDGWRATTAAWGGRGGI